MKKITLGLVLLVALALVGCQSGEKEVAEVKTDVVTIDVTDNGSVSVETTPEQDAEAKKVNVQGDVVVKTVEVTEPTEGNDEPVGPVVQKLVYYHGAECPHCHSLIKFLPEVKKLYPNIEFEEYEVWHNPQNAERGKAHVRELGEEFRAVPTIIVKDEVLTGFNEEQLLDLLARKLGSPKQ